MTCIACSNHCITCNSTMNCLICDAGFPLYLGVCVTNCPTQSTFLNATGNLCIECPISCLTCSSRIICNFCVTNYYLDQQLFLCFLCHQNCLGCYGPAINQCLDCQYPLYFKNDQCFNITCPYGQYIDSHRGCLNCSD
jgi:proprotein convertase subtilisin/kexin type 5